MFAKWYSRWCLDDRPIYSNSWSTKESSMENKPDENCQYDLKKIDFVHVKLRWWMQNQRVWTNVFEENLKFGPTSEAEAKWPPFSRQHFQMYFLKWKCMNFD